MEKTISKQLMDKMYDSTELIEEIRQIDFDIRVIKKSASLLANDLKGQNTVSMINFDIKDLYTVKEELKTVEDNAQKQSPISILGIPEGHPMAQIFAISDPVKQEYQVHEKHTNKTALTLNPSEALIMLAPMVTILETRKEQLVTQLKNTFPFVEM